MPQEKIDQARGHQTVPYHWRNRSELASLAVSLAVERLPLGNGPSAPRLGPLGRPHPY